MHCMQHRLKLGCLDRGAREPDRYHQSVAVGAGALISYWLVASSMLLEIAVLRLRHLDPTSGLGKLVCRPPIPLLPGHART